METKIVWENEIENLILLLESGKTELEISEIYEVRRQRIHQIIHKYDLVKYKAERESAIKKRLTREKIEKLRHIKESTDLYNKYKKYLHKRSAAKSLGIPFTLEFEEIDWPEVCPMLGIKLDYFTHSKGRAENSVSFDRINPCEGYIKDNVIICSDRANRIKNNGTADEHLKIAYYMLKMEKQLTQ
jgi:hypothetical protein